MGKTEQIIKALKVVVNDKFQTQAGKVVSVNKELSVCSIQSYANQDLVFENVQLRAKVDKEKGSFIIYPLVDSDVLISNIEFTDVYFVSSTAKADEIIFLDGQNGGLIVANDLVKQLDKTNEALQVIIDSFAKWIVTPNDGGFALKTLVSEALSEKKLGDYSKITNDRIKH